MHFVVSKVAHFSGFANSALNLEDIHCGVNIVDGFDALCLALRITSLFIRNSDCLRKESCH